MANPLALHPLGTESAGGAGPVFDITTDRSTLRVEVDVQALGGASPALSVLVESSPDQLAWTTVEAIGPLSASGTVPPRTVAGLSRYVRASWALAGTTPTATFAVHGLAVVQYASLDDLKNQGLPRTAFMPPIGMTQAELDAAVNDQLVAVSEKVDGYLRGASRYEVPVAGVLGPANSYPPAIVKAVTDLLGYDFLVWRGFNPGEFDDQFRLRAEAAERWLNAVAKRQVVLDLPEPAPEPGGGSSTSLTGRPRVRSLPNRGWNC